MVILDASIGLNTKIYHPELVNMYSCTIGEDCNIGAFVEIRTGVRIGNKVKIQVGAFLPEGVVIEDEVFIGPHVCFTNDLFPRSTKSKGAVITKKDWKAVPTLVKKGASIGANATILCGVTIGRGAMVGAGAVVVADVEEGTTVVGNPAKKVKNK